MKDPSDADIYADMASKGKLKQNIKLELQNDAHKFASFFADAMKDCLNEISNQIDGEKLFLQAYNIYPKFEISYKNKEIKISINTENLPKSYVYYIFELLNIINNQICWV